MREKGGPKRAEARKDGRSRQQEALPTKADPRTGEDGGTEKTEPREQQKTETKAREQGTENGNTKNRRPKAAEESQNKSLYGER